MKRDIRLSETTEAGRTTTEWIVRASSGESRDWLVDAPVCAALARYGIVHVGAAEAVHPYRVVRTDLSGTFVMSCTSGEGRVWMKGRWERMGAGMACLAPPHTVHAYRALLRKRWSIAWVRYQEPEGGLPIVNARAPVLARFDGGPLRAAIEGMHREASGVSAPAALQLWADLIEHYVGYGSLFTFSHRFKEFTGFRPSAYRSASLRSGRV